MVVDGKPEIGTDRRSDHDSETDRCSIGARVSSMATSQGRGGQSARHLKSAHGPTLVEGTNGLYAVGGQGGGPLVLPAGALVP